MNVRLPLTKKEKAIIAFAVELHVLHVNHMDVIYSTQQIFVCAILGLSIFKR